MGTVLSFSPRERRPVYSTHHHSTGLSSSGSVDFPLNNYSYEQLNNVKNRENNKSSLMCPVPNNNANGGNVVLLGGGEVGGGNGGGIGGHIGGGRDFNSQSSLATLGSHNQNHGHHQQNNINNGHQLMAERNADNARILSEKNALEKNLKKHSLFINALSWKRLAASHGKKKLDNNNKNKTVNLPTATFRPPLVDAIHPLLVDKNKNIQPAHQPNHHHQLTSHAQHAQQLHSTQQVYFTPGAPKTLLALDLVRANNTNNTQQLDKLAPKLPLSLPLPHMQTTTIATNQQQQQQQQQSHHHILPPRKTIIQVIVYMELIATQIIISLYEM